MSAPWFSSARSLRGRAAIVGMGLDAAAEFMAVVGQHGLRPGFPEPPRRTCYSLNDMSILTRAGSCVVFEGEEVLELPAYCWGNNAAIQCPNQECEHPVLLTARVGWPGSREDRPARCPDCKAKIWMISTAQPAVEVMSFRSGTNFATIEAGLPDSEGAAGATNRTESPAPATLQNRTPATGSST